MEMFERREVAKSYLALVDGIPKDARGTRQSLLVKKGSYEGQTIWGSGQKGLTAITHWKRIAVGNHASLILCEPVTGRTHQIRVHMAEMGHPILVDRQYAKVFRSTLFIQRPLLHAYRLQFTFQGKEIDVIAPIPADLREALSLAAIEVRHLREFLRNEKHENTGDERHNHKNAEEVEETSRPIHESC